MTTTRIWTARCVRRVVTLSVVAMAAVVCMVVVLARLGYGLEKPAATLSGPSAAELFPWYGDAQLLDELVIAEEDPDAGYDPQEWGESSPTETTGCALRERVLVDHGVGVTEGAECLPICPSGNPCWTSSYDGEETDNPAVLAIDHRVSLREAARSRVVGSGPAGDAAVGAGRAWGLLEKLQFSQDASNLAVVTAAVQAEKQGRDAAGWMPPVESAWCGYASQYVITKISWGLSVDQAEYDWLAKMLRSCTGR